MSKFIRHGLLGLAALFALSGCSKQMDEFVSRIAKVNNPLLIPFEDDGMNYLRVSAGHELAKSTSYEATLLVGSPVVQIEGVSTSATIQMNRTTLQQ